MTSEKHRISYKAKGSLGENEDWWYLVVDSETGERSILHEWHNMNPYNSTVTSEGSKSHTLEEFKTSDVGRALKGELAEILDKFD